MKLGFITFYLFVDKTEFHLLKNPEKKLIMPMNLSQHEGIIPENKEITLIKSNWKKKFRLLPVLSPDKTGE